MDLPDVVPASGNSRIDELVAGLVRLGGAKASADKLRRAFEGHDRILEQLPASLIENGAKVSEALGMSPAAFVRACSGHPDLLYQSPDTMRDRAKRMAELLGLPMSGWIKSVGNSSYLLMIDPDSARNHITAVAAGLDLDEAAFGKVIVRMPRLLALRVETLMEHANGLAEALGIELSGAVSVAVKRPDVLLHGPKRIGELVDELERRLEVERPVICKALIRCPALLLQRPDTLIANLEVLCSALDAEREKVVRAAMTFPILLYLKPQGVLDGLREAGHLLGVPTPAMCGMLLRMPSLAGRDPRSLARRIRLGVRIWRSLGIDASPQDVIEKWPAVGTYGVERLLLRWLMVRLGLWQGGLGALIVMPESLANGRLIGYLYSLPGDSLEAERLERLLLRRQVLRATTTK